MTVYADVLLIVNLFVNYSLLQCSSMILKIRANRLRILLGAVVGSIYGLVIFLPSLPHGVELVMRAAASLLIVFCTFGFQNRARFMRCFFTFFAVSFAFGGVMLALWVTVAPVGMFYNNSTVYFDIDLLVLAISTIVSFTVISVISHFISRKAPRNYLCTVTVENLNSSICGKGLLDTGNSLRESFSGYPVIICELSVAKKIMPDAAKKFIEKNELIADKNIRFVMHRTVSGIGMLPAFKPDSVHIKTIDGEITTDSVYIAISSTDIALGEYDFIVNPIILEGAKTYEKITV